MNLDDCQQILEAATKLYSCCLSAGQKEVSQLFKSGTRSISKPILSSPNFQHYDVFNFPRNDPINVSWKIEQTKNTVQLKTQCTFIAVFSPSSLKLSDNQLSDFIQYRWEVPLVRYESTLGALAVDCSNLKIDMCISASQLTFRNEHNQMSENCAAIFDHCFKDPRMEDPDVLRTTFRSQRNTLLVFDRTNIHQLPFDPLTPSHRLDLLKHCHAPNANMHAMRRQTPFIGSEGYRDGTPRSNIDPSRGHGSSSVPATDPLAPGSQHNRDQEPDTRHDQGHQGASHPGRNQTESHRGRSQHIPTPPLSHVSEDIPDLKEQPQPSATPASTGLQPPQVSGASTTQFQPSPNIRRGAGFSDNVINDQQSQNVNVPAPQHHPGHGANVQAHYQHPGPHVGAHCQGLGDQVGTEVINNHRQMFSIPATMPEAENRNIENINVINSEQNRNAANPPSHLIPDPLMYNIGGYRYGTPVMRPSGPPVPGFPGPGLPGTGPLGPSSAPGPSPVRGAAAAAQAPAPQQEQDVWGVRYDHPPPGPGTQGAPPRPENRGQDRNMNQVHSPLPLPLTPFRKINNAMLKLHRQTVDNFSSFGQDKGKTPKAGKGGKGAKPKAKNNDVWQMNSNPDQDPDLARIPDELLYGVVINAENEIRKVIDLMQGAVPEDKWEIAKTAHADIEQLLHMVSKINEKNSEGSLSIGVLNSLTGQNKVSLARVEDQIKANTFGPRWAIYANDCLTLAKNMVRSFRKSLATNQGENLMDWTLSTPSQSPLVPNTAHQPPNLEDSVAQASGGQLESGAVGQPAVGLPAGAPGLAAATGPPQPQAPAHGGQQVSGLQNTPVTEEDLRRKAEAYANFEFSRYQAGFTEMTIDQALHIVNTSQKQLQGPYLNLEHTLFHHKMLDAANERVAVIRAIEEQQRQQQQQQQLLADQQKAQQQAVAQAALQQQQAAMQQAALQQQNLALAPPGLPPSNQPPAGMQLATAPPSGMQSAFMTSNNTAFSPPQPGQGMQTNSVVAPAHASVYVPASSVQSAALMTGNPVQMAAAPGATGLVPAGVMAPAHSSPAVLAPHGAAYGLVADVGGQAPPGPGATGPGLAAPEAAETPMPGITPARSAPPLGRSFINQRQIAFSFSDNMSPGNVIAPPASSTPRPLDKSEAAMDTSQHQGAMTSQFVQADMSQQSVSSGSLESPGSTVVQSPVSVVGGPAAPDTAGMVQSGSNIMSSGQDTFDNADRSKILRSSFLNYSYSPSGSDGKLNSPSAPSFVPSDSSCSSTLQRLASQSQPATIPPPLNNQLFNKSSSAQPAGG